MPWKETCVMDERTKFIGRLLQGEKMAPLCREFGISRVTGYKIWNRYEEFGSLALLDQSRRPNKHPNQLPFELESLIVRLKKERPNWGAPKIRELLAKHHSGIKLPATSTVHEVLDRHGLVKRRKRQNNHKAIATYLSSPNEINDLWCVDFKGEFKLGNKAYCYPLTISDFRSRFLINCEALPSTGEATAFRCFEETFKEYGLPSAVRSDHGIPFASGNSLWGLTRLSVWWMRLGIKLERITPGCPQENGRHERMHRTLKLEATKPPAFSVRSRSSCMRFAASSTRMVRLPVRITFSPTRARPSGPAPPGIGTGGRISLLYAMPLSAYPAWFGAPRYIMTPADGATGNDDDDQPIIGIVLCTMMATMKTIKTVDAMARPVRTRLERVNGVGIGGS